MIEPPLMTMYRISMFEKNRLPPNANGFPYLLGEESGQMPDASRAAGRIGP